MRREGFRGLVSLHLLLFEISQRKFPKTFTEIYEQIYNNYCNNNGRVKCNYLNQPFLKFP